MLAAITLNDSARSPSWSRLCTRMRLPKSPWRRRSVPRYSSWMLPVMDRASMRPRPKATKYITRNTPATAANAFTRTSPRFKVPGESRRRRS